MCKFSQTSYKTLLDEERFEEQTLDFQIGYYDKVEKVFIPQSVFDLLLQEIKPETRNSMSDTQLMTNVSLQKSRQRVTLNLQQIYKVNKDSYSQVFLGYLSRRFLLKNKNKKEDMVILYVDLVGSTALSAILSSDQLGLLVRIFCQEMSILISRYKGYILKYAGDAVIAYFPKDPDIRAACENAISCALSMKRVMEESINMVFLQNNYPKLKIRIAIDVGKNQIVVLGSDPDLLGHVISRAAKIISKAKPNQIAIGDSVFKNLDDHLRQTFGGLVESYTLVETGEIYSVYLSTD